MLDLNALINQTELDSIVEDIDALIHQDSWNVVDADDCNNNNINSDSVTKEEKFDYYYYDEQPAPPLDSDELSKLNSISESLEHEIYSNVFLADTDPMMMMTMTY